MEPLWMPSDSRRRAARITAFTRHVRERYGLADDTYQTLWRWSVSDRAAFWSELFDFLGVIGDKGDRIVESPDAMPGARWFPDARLSFAENLLAGPEDELAILFSGEEETIREVSRGELRRLAAGIAAGLVDAGVGPGDRVAGFLPNLPESVAAMLGTASIGAIWSSTSPDFGVKGVLDRFGQIEPKVLFTADGYRYGGREYDSLDRARQIAHGIPSVSRVVVVPRLTEEPDVGRIPGAVHLRSFAAGGGDHPPYERGPFDHPLCILYSSGTTGVPKCIVHGQGGTLLQHGKEHVLHTDVVRGTRLFYFTTTGWMMWNWLVSGLARGAVLVLYDGSPFHPDPRVLLRLATRVGIQVFGTSAKYLAALEKAGVHPAREIDLRALQTILSTGSPLSGESFEYVYREMKRDVCLSSISGGTDIVSCFALGNPALPVWSGELQCRGLGMSVAAYDGEGRPVVGAKGELVCEKPFPSMPVGFWNDPDGTRYRAAYFERYPGVWHHGDFVTVTSRGGVVIHGRSDATLNPGGVRIGTAEIYRQVQAFPEVADSVVVGRKQGEDEQIVLFVVMRDGSALDETLAERIRRAIRENASPRHVPAEIHEVSAIPYTRSGKKVELAVRKVLAGEPVRNRDALANPESLDGFEEFR